MSATEWKSLLLKESRLRDFLAKNLQLIDPNLSLVKVEFPLKSTYGAAGAIDILAEDGLGHYVVIEIKRCNTVARAAIHELSKYVSLLRENEGLGRDEIRCIVDSSEWHELLEPFSYFRHVSDVHVDGIHVEATEVGLEMTPIEPRPVNNLPTFAPEFDFFRYSKKEERIHHWEWVQKRASKLPFIRAAMCFLDPTQSNSDFRSILCIWRIDDVYYERTEAICKFKIGHLELVPKFWTAGSAN